MTTVNAGDLILGSTNNGHLQHRSPTGTLIDDFASDLGSSNRVFGMCVDMVGNSYFCLQRVQTAKRVGAGTARNDAGIIQLDATFISSAAHEIDWGTAPFGNQPGTGGNVFTPVDICMLRDGTFLVLMNMHYQLVGSRPLGQSNWCGLWHLDASGVVLTRWDNVDTDFTTGAFFGRVARDCARPNIIYYTHYSETLFRFNLSSGTNMTPMKRMLDRRLPFVFGAVRPLTAGGVLVALSQGSRRSFGPFGTPGLLTVENNTPGPRDAIALAADGTHYFADQGFFFRNTSNHYNMKLETLADGSITSSFDMGANFEPSAMGSVYEPCGAPLGTGGGWVMVLE